ncbi:hypothetical protein LAZ67_12000713, partial [Cordylochernes scorpioides]
MEDVFIKAGTMAEKEALLEEKESQVSLSSSQQQLEGSLCSPDKDYFVKYEDSERFKKMTSIAKGLFLKRWNFTKRFWVGFVFQLLTPIFFGFLLMKGMDNLNILRKNKGTVVTRRLLDLGRIYGPTLSFFSAGQNLGPLEGIENIYVDLVTSEKASMIPLTFENLAQQLGARGRRNRRRYKTKLTVGGTVQSVGSGFLATAWYNYYSFHSVPISINLMMTSLLRHFSKNPQARILVINWPLVHQSDTSFNFGLRVHVELRILIHIFLPVGLALLTACYILFPVHERVTGSKLLQLMTGLHPTLFWAIHFLFDFCLCHLPASILFLFFMYLFDHQNFYANKPDVMGSMFLILIFYGLAGIPFVYLLSYLFNNPSTGFVFTTIVCLVTGIIAPITVMLVDMVNEGTASYLLWLGLPFPLFLCSYSFASVAALALLNSVCDFVPLQKLSNICVPGSLDPDRACCPGCVGDFCHQYISPFSVVNRKGAGQTILKLLLLGILYYTILVLMDLRRRRMPKEVEMEEKDSSEDQDVTSERRRIYSNIRGDSMDTTDCLTVLGLTKYFKTFPAVRGLTFGVRPNECFGLLGVNGAGKTTTFRMLIGDLTPTAGDAYLLDSTLVGAPRKHEETRSQATMIEQTHNQVPQEPTTDATVAAFLRTLTLCLDQLLNRESEEAITYDGDEPAAHFFSQLESQPNFHNLEPARQARKALSSLRGEPRKIAQDLALLNKTYEEVKESLCAVYPRRPSFTLQEFYELKCTSMAEIETYYKNKVRIGLAINLPKSAIVQALSNGVPPLKLPNNDHRARAEHLPPPWTRPHHILAVTVADNTGTHSVSSEGPTSGLFGPLHLRSTASSNPKDRLGLQVSTRPQQRRAREKPSNASFGSRTPPKLNKPTCTLNQHMPGIAGVLKQVHPDGNIYPVKYYSRALRSYERNYTISELECLAIVECVDKFRVYLLGTRFVIYSDHHALQWLKTIKDPTGRLFRWSLRLSAYDYEVKYLKGSRQYEADLLSRNPFCGFLSTGQIKDHQGELRRDTRYILNDKDLMTIIRRGVTKIIVPPSLRGTLLQRAHRDFNHPGISQMTRLIAAQYYWDGMTNDIRTHVRTCSVCQLVKPPKGPIYGELGQLPPAVLPYELVSLDTISGFAKYGNSQTCLHVVVDHATRYAWAFPSRSTSILTYTQVIKKVMQFGSPKRLLTDRAPAFTSPKFRRFLIRHNIGQLLTTSNNPQANGLSERLNATITGKLKLLRLQQPKTAWTKLLPQVLQAYNHTPHSVTGFPPSYLLLGSFPLQLSEHVQNYPKIDDARELAYQRTHERHLRDKARFDQTHRASDFEVGDLVLAKTYHHPDTGKLAPFFSGPYEILEIISPQIVRINRSNRPLSRETDTIHVNKLKHYTENEQFISPPFQSYIGYVPQSDALLEKLTGPEQLELFARLRGVVEEGVGPLVASIFAQVDLEGQEHTLAGVYSGGMKRKLSLGMAVIGRPKLVFLDEPTVSVDPVSRRRLWGALIQLRQTSGLTFLAMTLKQNDQTACLSILFQQHDLLFSMEECEALCTRVAIMMAGQIQCIGTLQHLKAKYGKDFTLYLKGSERQPEMDLLTTALEKAFPGIQLRDKHQ